MMNDDYYYRPMSIKNQLPPLCRLRSLQALLVSETITGVIALDGKTLRRSHDQVAGPDCYQCHQLQKPALQRILQERGDAITVVEVDATTEQTLAQTYHVLTVPSTVVLDATGKAHAVNYGFANTHRLLEQIDEALAKGERIIWNQAEEC